MLKKEKKTAEHLIFAGKAVNFRADTVKLQSGETSVREFMDHPGAAAALPILPGNKTLLIKQFRYPVNKFTLEIPAGKISGKESPLACIKRELAEETGFSASRFIKILDFNPTSAFSNEIIRIYLAENLTKSNASPDDDEFIEPVIMSMDKAVALAEENKIKDSKTLIALLYWKAFGRLIK